MTGTEIIRRCCRHEIHRYTSMTDYRQPAEGTIIQCADCLRCLRWTTGAWTPISDIDAPPAADAARDARADQITWGRFSKGFRR